MQERIEVTSEVGQRELGDIPGGWSEREIPVGERTLSIILPADPDAFLEDPQTLADNERTDYMPYWPYLWPAAVTMSNLVVRADWPGPARVLEIGCGIGLVGLAALARGDTVTFSDYRDEAVALAAYNARRNGFETAEGLHLDWSEPLSKQFDVILGCEVIYERPIHALVLDVLDAMLAPGGICWIGDPGHHQAELFTRDAELCGYSVSFFDADGIPDHDHSAGRFRLIQLRR